MEKWDKYIMQKKYLRNLSSISLVVGFGFFFFLQVADLGES